MAIRVTKYSSISFTNDRILEFPVFSELYVNNGDEFVSAGKNVIFAAAYRESPHGSELKFYGIPFGSDDSVAWIDLDGHKWWIEDKGTVTYGVTTYQQFIAHCGPYSTSSQIIQLSTRAELVYKSQVVGLWACGYGSDIRIKSLGLNGTGHAALEGFNDYINSTIASSQFTWLNYPGNDINSAYGYLIDAYHFNPYYDDFGYVRFKINTLSGDQLGSYNYGTNLNNTFSNSYTEEITPSEYDDDPNKRGGNSGTGGGGGNFDNTSDAINVPDLPSLNATNAGFVTLYKPNLNEMIQLARRLWSPNVLDLVSELFGDPMDLVIGLGIVPVSAPANGTSSPSVGPLVIPLVLSVYDSQYYSYNCGSIDVNEYWGSALDYAPYTKIDIYLPYVGVRSLNVDEIMGHVIGVTYHIDLFGGATVAFVTVDGSVRYQFSGNCMQQIPVGKADYSQLIQNLVSVACVVGGGIAAAGAAGAAAAVGEEAATLGAGAASQGSAVASGMFGSEYADVRALGFSEWSDTGGGKALANCTMSSVMNSKPTIERTGSMSATNGQLSVQTPFLIITRPQQSLAENYKHYNGYPSNITAKLGNLSGYTKVDSIRINDLAATEPELAEIYSLLKKGVII